MDRRYLCLIFLIAFCVLAFSGATSPAKATSQEEMLQTFRDRMASFETAMQNARTVLESKPQAQWSDVEAEEYLVQALWVAFYGNLIQLYENKSQPATGDSFISTSAASSWPDNPFRNWEPMKVLSVDDPFSAGDLVFQPCPSGYESVTGGQIIYASFELSIYGADVNHGAYGETGSHPRNSAWARKPEGSLYSLGYWRESSQQTAERHRKREKAREEARKNAGK